MTNIQVIVATMNQTDYSLLEKMNIQSDAIVCNQCDRNEIKTFKYKGYNIQWLSFNEKGVGLNRNNGLMRATAEIVLFADDDMVYVDGYPQIIEKAFSELPDSDVIIFDLIYKDKNCVKIKKRQRLNIKSTMRFGAARICAKTEKLRMNGIFFNLCFGGGTKFSCGEDTLFLVDCLRKKLKIYSYPKDIATLIDDRESTWFKGYNDKFFYDKGVLYGLISRRFANFFALYHCFKHRKLYQGYGWKKAYIQMRKGILMK